MIEGQVKEGDGPDLATIDCFRGKRVKAQVPLIIIRYPFPPEPRMSNWSSLTPELGTKMPICLRTQQLSYLISTNQCHEPSILHKFVMMPHREIPRHQEDCFTSQSKNCQLWSMQTWSLKALQRQMLSFPALWMKSGHQDTIKGKSAQADQPYVITGHHICPTWQRERSIAVLLVPTGHRPAASNDSDSFTSKKEGLHWLEKSSDLKNPIYQWFCFFLKVWALQVSTNMFWLC